MASKKKELKSMMKSASEQQRLFVKSAAAGIADKKAARSAKLQMAISLGLKPTPATKAAAATAPPGVPAAAAVTKGSPAQSAALMTPKQQWQALKAQNPRLAANYYAINARAIDKDW